MFHMGQEGATSSWAVPIQNVKVYTDKYSYNFVQGLFVTICL